MLLYGPAVYLLTTLYQSRGGALQQQIGHEHMFSASEFSVLQRIYRGARLGSRRLDIASAEKPASSGIDSYSVI